MQKCVGIEERRRPARGSLGPKEEHGGGQDEDPARERQYGFETLNAERKNP